MAGERVVRELRGHPARAAQTDRPCPVYYNATREAEARVDQP